jgi:hypothetical protein
MSEPGGTPPPPPAPAAKRPSAFGAVASLLILCILICGVFAGFAGKKIGDKHLEFVIAFIFLGLVVLLIFGLAWVDANSRGPQQGPPHQ